MFAICPKPFGAVTLFTPAFRIAVQLPGEGKICQICRDGAQVSRQVSFIVRSQRRIVDVAGQKPNAAALFDLGYNMILMTAAPAEPRWIQTVPRCVRVFELTLKKDRSWMVCQGRENFPSTRNEAMQFERKKCAFTGTSALIFRQANPSQKCF